MLSESGRVGDLGESPYLILTRSHPILTHSHPVLTTITPVSKLLTHITYTHPKIKNHAILELRAHWELAAYYNGLKYGWADGKPCWS